MTSPSARVPYDEFAYFRDNAEEVGLPDDGPPAVRRAAVTLEDGRTLSALVWGTTSPELVLVHGGAQNAHTWDTVALALGRPLVAVDLAGHGHSDAPADTSREGRVVAMAADVAEAVRQLAPDAQAVVGRRARGIVQSAGGVEDALLGQPAPGFDERIDHDLQPERRGRPEDGVLIGWAGLPGGQRRVVETESLGQQRGVAGPRTQPVLDQGLGENRCAVDEIEDLDIP